MNLWAEMFATPVECPVSLQEFNQAWNWMFEDKETAPLKQSIARRHAVLLRRLGHVQAAQMALIGLFKRNSPKPIVERF